MNISISKEETNVIVKLFGELDTPTSNLIQPQIDELLAIKDKNFVIDCSELDYIASSGLRQLLSLLKATQRTKQTIVLTNVTPRVMTVFKISNFDKLFSIV